MRGALHLGEHARQFALDNLEILAQAIVLPQMPFHRLPLVWRQILDQEPGAAPVAEQIGMGALRQ